MIEGYVIVANRIRQELTYLEQVMHRAEQAIAATRTNPQDTGFYVDSAALNLHDLYAGLERIFRQIAITVDSDLPKNHDWHRELLYRMSIDLPDIRPPVLSPETTNALDEYLRFRHVVRNVYTFSLNLDQIARLVEQGRKVFSRTREELLTFAQFLERVGLD